MNGTASQKKTAAKRKAMDVRRAKEAGIRYGKHIESVKAALRREGEADMAAVRESQLRDDLKRAIDSKETWAREYERELKARHEAERVALHQRDYAKSEISHEQEVCAVRVDIARMEVERLTEERDAYRQTLVYLHRLAVTGAVRHPQADVLFSVVADEAVGILMECRAAKTPKEETNGS